MNSATDTATNALNGFVSFLPNLVAGLIILFIGYLVALLLGRATQALLRRTGYDRFLAKLGLLDQDRVDAKRASVWTGNAVFWVILLVAVMQATRAWNLEMVGVGIGRVIAYLPHVIGAAFIFAAALYFGSWVRDRMVQREKTTEAADQRPLIASAVRAGILALGAFMALRELQIAPEIVELAFGVTFASIGLAAALAFGLGSRGVAERVTQQWYDRRPGLNGGRRPPQPTTEPRAPSP
jgi:hypothetical protein